MIIKKKPKEFTKEQRETLENMLQSSLDVGEILNLMNEICLKRSENSATRFGFENWKYEAKRLEQCIGSY